MRGIMWKFTVKFRKQNETNNYYMEYSSCEATNVLEISNISLASNASPE
jgi:hypothetical protein